MLTQLLNERGDWPAWIREAWAQGITAAQLMAMRPCQIMATFFKPTVETVDKLEKLIRDNDARGKRGQRPQCPPWLKSLLTERTRGQPARGA